MPQRATKRGIERTPLERDCDVLICGASFAGLAVARELAGSGADVLLIDRYEIGERQTSACGIPTGWLEALDLQRSLQQTFGELVIHTPYTTVRYRLPWTFSTFDYRTLCELLADQGAFTFETAKVDGRTGEIVHTDRGDIRAPRDRRRARLAAGARRRRQHPAAGRPALARSRGPPARLRATTWRSGSTARTSPPATAGAFRPPRSCGSASARSIRASTCASRPTGSPTDLAAESVRYQGNWIPHALRNATEDGVFFVGDSAGHCLPLTAEGIRTALYFGLAVGRELHGVARGQTIGVGRAVELLPLQRLARARVRVDAAVPAAGPARGPAAARGRAARDGEQSGSSTGRSATTSRSHTRASSPPVRAGRRSRSSVPA